MIIVYYITDQKRYIFIELRNYMAIICNLTVAKGEGNGSLRDETSRRVLNTENKVQENLNISRPLTDS